MTTLADRIPGIDAWREAGNRTKTLIAVAAVLGLYALL